MYKGVPADKCYPKAGVVCAYGLEL